MKKMVALVLVICMAFALAACSAQSEKETSDSQSDIATGESQQNKQEAPTQGDDTSTPDAEAPGNGEDNTSTEETGSKVLVAYFSCTGNTKGIAEHIVNVLGADTYEIVPEEPYTDADLNYNNSSSRSTLEQNDASARPAISGSVENIEDYDVIFIGYPIWWGQAPKIIYTFIESYDFAGKTIVPFCTSASSGVGSSATNLHSFAAGANWLDGTRFSSNASESDIKEWIGGLGLELAEE